MMDTFLNTLILRARTDEKLYEVLKEENQFELRAYRKMLCAKVHLDDKSEHSMQNAIKLLYEYTLGHNFRVEKILNLGPIFQAFHGGGQEVSLIMPSDLTFNSAPKPINRLVRLVELSPVKVGVLKVRGEMRLNRVQKFERPLRKWINRLGFRANGPYRIRPNEWAFPLSLLGCSELMLDVSQD